MNKDKRNNIQLLGTLTNADESGIIANANQIYDDVQQKAQETINSELIAAVGTGGSVESRIASAVATETSRAQEAEANRYTKNETYTKEELNNLITTPNQEYVSVTATDQTTAVTDVLPAIGLADTIYRVGSWDGSQYDVTKYSEYAWNGKDYVHLSTKTQICEVFDISVYHATGGTLATYGNLEDALGTNGKNIPQSFKKGGMSVKFVQSSDNKYVQYRLMSDTFNTTEANWQGVDEVPIAGSKNLVESGGVADALEKVSKIEKEIIPSDSGEKVSFTDDEETETYAEIGSFGIKSKNYFDINGNDVVVTKDTEISDLPSTTNVPTSKAVVDYVTEHSITEVPISGNKTVSSEEKVSFTDDEETETYAEISSEGIKAKKYYFLDGTEVKLDNPYYILDASGNGDFTTVAQAISNVPLLGVVLVKPGEYSVKGCAFTKGQRFIGFTDSTECVFYVDDGLYGSAPAVMNGYFENLSFESRHKASNTSRRAYCVHIDFVTKVQDVPFEVKFINCTFKSWNADCLGCGGAKDFKLCLENCRLYQYGNDGGTEDAPPSPACFAMHGAANMASTSQYAGPVYVYIKDSVLITYTKSAIRFGYDRYTGTDNVTIPGGGEWELINNSLYSYKDNNGVPYGTNCVSKGNTDPISSFPIEGTGWTLSPLNHGNNSQVINFNNKN